MSSIKDVARLAGVSISTVSYVISGTRPVSGKTKELVRRAMEELSYRPHAVARALASRRSRIIALMLSPRERALGITETDLMTTAARRAAELNYHLILWPAGTDELKDLEDLKSGGLVDGLILMEIQETDSRVRRLRELGIPYQIIGRCAEDEGLFYGDIDFRTTVAEALNHLKALGHRRVALINQSEEAFASGYGPVIRVQKAFEELCPSRGMEGYSLFVRPGPEEGYRALKEILRRCPETSALLVMNDEAIPGILHGASDLGKGVPEDLSLISLVSSSRFAEMMVPALTEMEVPAAELMSYTVESLIRRLEGGIPPENGRLWPCTLRLRRSTAEVSQR